MPRHEALDGHSAQGPPRVQHLRRRRVPREELAPSRRPRDRRRPRPGRAVIPAVRRARGGFGPEGSEPSRPPRGVPRAWPQPRWRETRARGAPHRRHRRRRVRPADRPGSARRVEARVSRCRSRRRRKPQGGAARQRTLRRLRRALPRAQGTPRGGVQDAQGGHLPRGFPQLPEEGCRRRLFFQARHRLRRQTSRLGGWSRRLRARRRVGGRASTGHGSGGGEGARSRRVEHLRGESRGFRRGSRRRRISGGRRARRHALHLRRGDGGGGGGGDARRTSAERR